MIRISLAAVALALVCLVSLRASPAEAVFHLVQIDEVMAGANGNANIQFVEMRMCCGGQNTQGGNARLVFFDAAGVQTGEFIFPNNPNGGTNVSFLTATQAFADLPTTPTPDFIMPPLVQPGSGKVCYKNVPQAGFNVNLCLSYGNFAGDAETDVRGQAAGTPAPALPITGTTSLKRVANFQNFESGQFNADFALAVPEPINSLGESGGVLIPQPGDLIVTSKEDDPDPVRVGDELTYIVTVLNNSPNPATDVDVFETMPDGPTLVAFTSSQGNCVLFEGTSGVFFTIVSESRVIRVDRIGCALGTMASGGSATVTIVVTPAEVGTLENTASVSGSEADPDDSNNSASASTTVNPPVVAEVEPNDPIAAAQRLIIAASGSVTVEGVLGTIGGANVDDLDFYSFAGTAGDVVTIDIDGAVGGQQSFDSFIGLFGSGADFNLLAQNDDAPVIDPGSICCGDSLIENFALPATGIFTVGVTNCCRGFVNGGGVISPGVANGDYTLIISGLAPTGTPPAAFAPAFSVQPSDTEAGAVISPAVEVEIQDSSGDKITTASNEITMSIDNNPNAGTLSGTTTVAAVGGVAIFDDLSIDMPGSGYTLRASTSGLPSAISTPFTVAAVPPALTAPLVGQLVLEGDSRPDAGFLVDVAVEFFTTDTEPLVDAPAAVRQATTSLVPLPRMAEFEIPDAPQGSFHVAVTSAHTLTSVVRDVTIGASGETVNFRNLHEGDADDDGTIGLPDLAILEAAFGTCTAEVGFDGRADFDRNGCVGISDFGLLSIHFEEQSPIEVP